MPARSEASARAVMSRSALRQVRARLRPLTCTERNVAPAFVALMRMRLSTPTGASPVCRKASHARMPHATSEAVNRSSRERFFHGVDQLLERKWFCQKNELFPVRGEMLLECVLGIARNENDLQGRIA